MRSWSGGPTTTYSILRTGQTITLNWLAFYFLRCCGSALDGARVELTLGSHVKLAQALGLRSRRGEERRRPQVPRFAPSCCLLGGEKLFPSSQLLSSSPASSKWHSSFRDTSCCKLTCSVTFLLINRCLSKLLYPAFTSVSDGRGICVRAGWGARQSGRHCKPRAFAEGQWDYAGSRRRYLACEQHPSW